jgi:putative ATP-dependent endonuclease of the OLD family
MIKAIHIENFKIFQTFDLDFNNDLNILVGDNEAGKSPILEAIHLALTRRLSGHFVEHELSPHIFNRDCSLQFLRSLKGGEKQGPPKILIELYLDDESPALQPLRGSNNSKKTDHVGVKLEIVFDDEYSDEYAKLLEEVGEQKTVPSEYYKVNWYSFSNSAITARSLPISVFHIDATTIRLQSGTDYYVQNLINEGLDPKARAALSVAYRKMREGFSDEAAIQDINRSLASGAITTKAFSLCLDATQRSSWEAGLVPHLDSIPLNLVGKGEQTCLKILLALERKAKDCNIVLVEEPENHLSYSSMNHLISEIAGRCAEKQVIMTTHSAYVLNKLGIDRVILLNAGTTTSLSTLPPDTQTYFKKLSGYDTLRLILAKKAILVEGPSDELVVQRAYMDKYAKLPIEDGIDVINVRGLSFPRFLEIAKRIRKPVVVVTDNDGDYQRNVIGKYGPYASDANIKICASDNNGAPTLEPQIIAANRLDDLNALFGTEHASPADLQRAMLSDKTEFALRLFESPLRIQYPQYINDAIA